MNEDLIDLSPTPFPPLNRIRDVCASILGGGDAPPIERAQDLGILHFADSPVGRAQLQALRKSCPCFNCQPPNPSDTAMRTSKCKVEILFLGFAKFVADTLALSLFDNPQDLLVKTSSVRLLRNHEDFLKHVLAVVKTRHQTECDPKHILTYARVLLGHRPMVKGLGDANFD